MADSLLDLRRCLLLTFHLFASSLGQETAKSPLQSSSQAATCFIAALKFDFKFSSKLLLEYHHNIFETTMVLPVVGTRYLSNAVPTQYQYLHEKVPQYLRHHVLYTVFGTVFFKKINNYYFNCNND